MKIILSATPDSEGGKRSAYDQIKHLILTGALRPMERITEEEFAAKLGLSRTPIREAFGLLAAEGLIVVIPQRGSFVSNLSVDDLLEIYQIRVPLECMAVRIAAQALTQTDLEELDRIVASQLQDKEIPPEQSLAASAAFHDIINGSVRNKRLQALLTQLQSQVHRVRALWPLTVPRLRETWREHADLLTALKARDGAKAEKLMWDHLEKARMSTLSQMMPILSSVDWAPKEPS
ncbi:MAG: GntR family transcriptional regulator [Pseudorhodoplanes sp.]